MVVPFTDTMAWAALSWEENLWIKDRSTISKYTLQCIWEFKVGAGTGDKGPGLAVYRS